MSFSQRIWIYVNTFTYIFHQLHTSIFAVALLDLMIDGNIGTCREISHINNDNNNSQSSQRLCKGVLQNASLFSIERFSWPAISRKRNQLVPPSFDRTAFPSRKIKRCPYSRTQCASAVSDSWNVSVKCVVNIE